MTSLTEITTDVWTVDGPQVPYTIGPIIIQCPTRMTIIRNQRGELLIHSPIEISEEMVTALERLGKVSGILIPNSFHYLFAGTWLDRYPESTVYVPTRLPKALDLKERPTRPARSLDDDWQGVITTEEVDAEEWSEVAVFHRPTRTLVLTDLMQNFPTSEIKSLFIRLFLRIGGAARTFPTTSLEMRVPVYFRGRRKNVRNSFDTIRSWKPERILIAHGPQPTGDTDLLLKRGFSWV